MNIFSFKIYTCKYILSIALHKDHTFICQLWNDGFCCQVGEGEKLVRALFAVARELQPSVIFIGNQIIHVLKLSFPVFVTKNVITKQL